MFSINVHSITSSSIFTIQVGEDCVCRICSQNVWFRWSGVFKLGSTAGHNTPPTLSLSLIESLGWACHLNRLSYLFLWQLIRLAKKLGQNRDLSVTAGSACGHLCPCMCGCLQLFASCFGGNCITHRCRLLHGIPDLGSRETQHLGGNTAPYSTGGVMSVSK